MLCASVDTKDQQSTMPVENVAHRFLIYRRYCLVPDPSRFCGEQLRNVMYVTLPGSESLTGRLKYNFRCVRGDSQITIGAARLIRFENSVPGR